MLRTCTLRLVIRRAIGEEIRVDFNRGSGGGSGAGGSSGGAGVPPPPRVSGSASGGTDFNYRDLGPSFVQTAREVLFNPVGFFRGISRQGDYLNPLVFAIICALLSAVIGAVLQLVINLIAGNGVGPAFASFVGTLIFLPIGTA